MDLKVTHQDHIAIVEIPGDNLEASNAVAFKEAIGAVLETHKQVIFDLSQLQFVDSSGLGAMLSCLKKLNALQGGLKLCGVTKPVQSLFELVRMNRVFSIYATQEEAIQAF